MGKPTICIGETKTQISFAVSAKLISAFVFATRIAQFLFYLNPKFQASSSFLCLYRPVCVGPVRKPHCWFSHEAAKLYSVGVFVTYTKHIRIVQCSLLSTRRIYCTFDVNLSRLVGKPTMWFSNRSDTNWSVSSQKMARSLKFWS